MLGREKCDKSSARKVTEATCGWKKVLKELGRDPIMGQGDNGRRENQPNGGSRIGDSIERE
jgi:hypothetical protein